MAANYAARPTVTSAVSTGLPVVHGAPVTNGDEGEERAMGGPQEDLAKAAQLPEGDVIGILLRQHARIQELFSDIESATGEHKRHAFDELRALLAVHETAEEMVLRPVTRKTAGEEVARARMAEEDEATKVLKHLEKLDTGSAEFDQQLAGFKQAVVDHAEHEEHEEFPAIIAGRDAEERVKLGKALLRAEKLAPTHPHPSAAGSTAANYVMGPFASLLDKARDAVSSAGKD